MKEAAELLRVSDKTVYRWIRQGVIPTFRYHGQYRFDRRELESWARYKRISPGGHVGAPREGEEPVNLLVAVRRGGIHYKIEGDTPERVIRTLVEYIPFTPVSDAELREQLARTLVQREGLASTGIGHGIAIPHPRHPQPWGFGDPVVGIFFLERAVDWGAFDGEPVYVLFLTLCATVKGHLQMLAQVSHLLHRPEAREALRAQPNRTELMERLTAILDATAHGRQPA